MQKLQHRSRIVLAALLLLVAATVACSGESESSDETIGNYESCKGFFSPKIVEEQTATVGLVGRERVLEVSAIEGLADSGAINNCLIEVFRTVDGGDDPAPGDSVTLSIVRFETEELALSLFNSTLAAAIMTAEEVGALAEFQQNAFGADSYLMDVKFGGIGGIVVFAHKSVFVSMSSTADARGNALLDNRMLITAAQGVKTRLP